MISEKSAGARWVPWLLTLSLAVLYNRVPSITGSDGGPAPDGVELVLPATYIAFSPLSRVLDTLTMLANAQSAALFASIAIVVFAWVLLSQRNAKRALWRRVAIALVIVLASIATLEAATVFLPRDMARVESRDPDVVRVDFHSHTGTSHDVRKSFGPEDNRDWHQSGGFDIAYVTDHVKFDGAVEARAKNPTKAGEGTSLLTGVEGRYHRIMSTIVLGVDERDSAMFDRRGNLLGAPISRNETVTIIALPNRNLDSVTTALLDSIVALPNLSAIELVDAAPRGLAQLDREEARVRKVASDLGLVLVAASNHHGFGRAVAGWNLMRVPGWRELPPDSVGRLIEGRLRERRTGSVEVIRRTRPGVHGPAAALTLPVIVYQVLGSLTFIERLVWIAWIWGLFSWWLLRNRTRAATNRV